ncbi:uncharacterized protein CBL_03623 [Carabus blaptoides fortunei]
MTDIQNSENIKEKISKDKNSENIAEDKVKENCEVCTDKDCPPDGEKELCEGVECPAVQNKKINSLKEGLADLDKILASLQGVCKHSMCPFSKNSKIETTPDNTGNIKETVKKSIQLTENCGGETCPDVRRQIAKKKDEFVRGSVVPKDNKSVLCKGPICYSAYMGYKFTPGQKTFNYPASSPLSHNTKYENSSENKKDYNRNTNVPCGGTACPYTLTNTPEPASTSYPSSSNGKTELGLDYLKTGQVDFCGRPSCPYTSIGNTFNQNVQRNTVTARSNNVNCEQPTCPFSKSVDNNLLTGMATGIFPSGNTDAKQYHCGSPSCTNLNPSSMVYTHYYANDYGFVQEAARPYCGSASPYDYLSSINNKYPNVLASNYPTFDSSNVAGCSVPCPYLTNQDGRARIEDDGICGTGKNYSCDHPDVEKCGSPDCKITEGKTSDLKRFQFCEDCGGVKPEQEIAKTVTYDASTSETTKHINTPANVEEEKTMIQKLSEKVVIKSNESARATVNNEESITKVPKKKDKKPVLYTYPGIQIGHKDCLLDKKQVPGNMGWLWNIVPQGNKELWRGYKPGAVSRTVHRMMRAHKKSLNILDSSSDVIRKKKSKTKTFKPEDMKHYVELKKKEGDIYVTVNPVRDPQTIGPADSPFMDVTPMLFKIEKNQVKKEEAYCPCDEVSDKACPSSVSSELEFVFSPPAAIPPVRHKKKKHLQEIDTQYDVKDLPVEFRGEDVTKKNAGAKGKKGRKGGGTKGGKKDVKAKKKK